MQNQNVHPWSWGQGSTPTFPAGQTVLPTTFLPTGVDQSSLLSGYQQMYGNAPTQPPTDYSQWTAAQLQQWQQWQQWQEKYQQWQAQYGKKYAESLAAMGQNPNIIMPGLPPVMGISKPVEPPTCATSVNPPLPSNSQPVPPPPPDEEKPPLPATSTKEGVGEPSKNGSQTTQDNPEELSEAEKTFDIQFKQWESQFNEWKKQNQDHPDKVQYREYEKKWETWREQLLQRREQMRKKRLSKAAESASDNSNQSKAEDSKDKQPTSVTAESKPTEADYSYKTQTGSQTSFNSDPTKLENKPPLFDKPPPSQVGVPPPNFSQSGNQNLPGSVPPIASPGNFGNFGGGSDKIENNRQGTFPNSQNFNKTQGPFGNQGLESGQDKNFSQGLRFASFEGNDGSFNQRFRNPNSDAQRFSGNFDNFPQRQPDRISGNFGPPQRFPGAKIDSRNERDFGQDRFYDNRDVGSFGKGNFDFPGRGNDFRPPDVKSLQNPPPGPSPLFNNPPLRPKVPSLFDITVEKPPGLAGTSADRKPKIWEKYEKDDYYDDPFEKGPEERESERNEKVWGSSWPKNAPSPWLQPWEIEKMGAQRLSEPRTWDRENLVGKNDGPWLKDLPGKQEIDKAELSGYVGNILAKLGNFNVMPPNLSNLKNESPQESASEGVSDTSLKKDTWNDGGNKRHDEEQNYPSGVPSNQSGDSFRSQNRSGPDKDQFDNSNFGPTGARDVDEREKNFSDRPRDGPFRQRNDQFSTHFDGSSTFSRTDTDERTKNFDVDERVTGRDDRFQFRRDDRGPFGRDEGRNYSRPGVRDERGNFGNDDRFFGREDNGPFGRGGRDFGRFNARDDIDERFGRSRNGRRGFDRFDRDDREGRGFFDRQGGRVLDGPFDRFGRSRDQVINEPVWNPQVFDYSQGRPQRLPNPDDGFKISTVVDYSHGEKKQTFDYGHGEGSSDKIEMKSFDYGHRTEAPTVIDYGHGVDKDSISKDWRRDRNRENEQGGEDRQKINSGIQSPVRKRSRSPLGRLRSRSRSPHSRYKRESISPPFRGHRSWSRDRLGRQMFRRNGSEDKLSPQSGGDNDVSRHSFDVTTVLVEDLICLPGRESRPSKLVFIMRGLPGSGKTYVSKLIKDKEVELGGEPPRILSLDDYFMTEVEKETVDQETGRKVKTKVLEYEYEAAAEPHYRGSLLKAFKKTVSDGFFSFIIVDSVNEKTKDYEEMWSFAKQKGFQVYIAEIEDDVAICTKRNIHKRTEKEISDLAKAWEGTPAHYLRLDVRSLLQADAITEVEMEVVSDTELENTDDKDEKEEDKGEEGKNEKDQEDKDKDKDKEDKDEDEAGVSAFVKSRWDHFENSEQKLDRLDGLKRRREGFHTTMEDYLQLPDDDFDLQANESGPEKKRVRWADLEERRQQEKMRAIGFVVGQTDWNRMTDPTFGESALTRTKYI